MHLMIFKYVCGLNFDVNNITPAAKSLYYIFILEKCREMLKLKTNELYSDGITIAK